MDAAVIKFYRNLLRTRFEHAGSFENASIFVDTSGALDKVLLCGNTGEFMQIYVNVADNKIADIKYNCVCDPTANVAVEILCSLVQGKTLGEVSSLTEQAILNFLGSNGEELQKKAKGLLDLLNRGISRYRAQVK